MALSTLDQTKIDRIKQELRWHPSGMTISALSSKMKMNRNLLAKYLDTLLISGQVMIRITGTAKVYSLSERLPLHGVLDFISEAIIVLDNDLQILSVNESLLSLLQVERDVLIGKKIDSSGQPFLSALPLPRLRHNLEPSAEVFFEMESTFDKKTCRIRVKPLPVVFDNGSRGIVLILEDITARKDTPQPSQSSSIRLHGIVEDQTEFVFRFMPDGKISFADDTFRQYFQKDLDAVIGSSVLSYLVRDDREQVMLRLRSLDRQHPACSLEHRVIGPSGLPRWHRWTYTALSDDEGNVREFLCAGRDISDRREVAEKMNQHIADQWFLYRSSHVFASLPDNADIYDTIARGAKEILPDAVIAVNTVDPTFRVLTTRCFLGEKEREVFSRLIGRDVIGMVMEAPDSVEKDHVIQNLLGGKLVKVPGNMSVMMMGMVPDATCQKIEDALNIGDMYVLGLVSQNVLFGNLAIMLRKGDVLKRNVALETFARQASMSLKLLLTEQALKKQGITERFGYSSPSDEREFGIEGEPPVFYDTGSSTRR